MLMKHRVVFHQHLGNEIWDMGKQISEWSALE